MRDLFPNKTKPIHWLGPGAVPACGASGNIYGTTYVENVTCEPCKAKAAASLAGKLSAAAKS